MIAATSKADLFLWTDARTLLDIPGDLHAALGLPPDTPLLPIFEDRDAKLLRKIVALDEVSARKAMRALACGKRSARKAIAMVRTMFKVWAMFDQMAFTRAERDAMPDGYRRALIAQRRRQTLHTVACKQ